MPKRPSSSLARKAFAKAEADFATWLMMAKLGSFDDLPAPAQNWLMSYRGRLERLGEAEATRETIREMYAAYYTEMGGSGEAPALGQASPAPDGAQGEHKIVALKDFRKPPDLRKPQDLRKPPTARLAASPAQSRGGSRSLPPLLIFAGMVAALAAAKFAFGF
jgi:hypothetical protein